MDSIPAAERPRRTTSLMAEWRGMRPALKRHDNSVYRTRPPSSHICINEESCRESDAESVVVNESADSVVED